MTAALQLIMPDLLAERPGDAVESAILSLVEMGADRQQIELIPVGIFRRYRGQLLGFYPALGVEVRQGDTIRLYVAERGLADRLPEGLLAPLPDEGRPESVFDTQNGGIIPPTGWEAPPDGAPGQGYDPEELFHRQLDGGRKLLRLLDRALRRARRDVILQRQSLKFLVNDPRFARNLLGLLHLEALDSGDAAAVYAAASLAGFQDAVGTLEEAAAFLAQLFQVEVRAEEARAGMLPIPKPLHMKLGGPNARLGQGSVPGRNFRDPRPAVKLLVGPMGAENAARRYRDEWARRSFENAAAAMVPASRPFKVIYDVVREERKARPGLLPHALLGQTMYLGRPRTA